MNLYLFILVLIGVYAQGQGVVVHEVKRAPIISLLEAFGQASVDEKVSLRLLAVKDEQASSITSFLNNIFTCTYQCHYYFSLFMTVTYHHHSRQSPNLQLSLNTFTHQCHLSLSSITYHPSLPV